MSILRIIFSFSLTQRLSKKAIILNATARQVLETLPREQGNPYVICGHKQGQHLVNLQNPWRRIRKRAGLEDVRLHDLRHTFACWAAKKGGSLPQIGAVLGHKQAQTTQRYAHLVPDHLRNLVEDVSHGISVLLKFESN